MMNKILYIFDNNENKDYKYNISEDTIIYHFGVNSSSNVEINLVKDGICLYYYYSAINYNDNYFNIRINHLESNTHSEVINHGVNVGCSKLNFIVDGIVPKKCTKCICNQDNQIINIKDGRSTIKPNLFIDNYDVISNHAAYIGKFRDEVIFYLMSRGIDRKKCYELLIYGFLISDDSIDKNKIEKFVDEIKKI